MKQSRKLFRAACLTALLILTAVPASAAQAAYETRDDSEIQEKEAPLPTSIHEAEDIFFVKHRGANPTLKRLAQVFGARGAWPLLEEGRNAMDLARSPRREYSAIAYDSYAKTAWECAALILIRAEQGESWSGDEALQGAQAVLDEAAGYFLMSPEQRERFYARTRAELAVADQALKSSRIYTMFCTVRHDEERGVVRVKPRAAEEIRLPDSSEDARILLSACVDGAAAKKLDAGGACLASYARDADGAFLQFLSVRPQADLPKKLPRPTLKLEEIKEDGERLGFRVRIANPGEQPLRLVTRRASRSRASIGNNQTSHFIYFGADEFLARENPAGQPDEGGNALVALSPGDVYEAEYSVRLDGLPQGADSLYFTGEYTIVYNMGGEELREMLDLKARALYRPKLGWLDEALRDGKAAMAVGDFPKAIKLFDEGIGYIGDSYYADYMVDDTGLKLLLSYEVYKEGKLEQAATLRRNVLSNRLSLLKERSG